MLLLTEEIAVNNQFLKRIGSDAEKTAAACQLIYVSDNQPGLTRIKKADEFVYVDGGKRIKDKKTIERIKKLVIPPAWEKVWICKQENGHLQVTGIDIKGRKQYKYHTLWSQLRNHTKFYRLYEFGKRLPSIRSQVEQDLSCPGLPLKKVLATIVYLMEKTSIRIGNAMYEKLYGSYGLTTLKDQHVKISGSTMQFIFKGKKGVKQNISLTSKRLALIVKKCRDIPGKELFQYKDESGEYRCVDSGQVNDYIQELSKGDFTAKDFRTWTGTLHALRTFKEIGLAENKTAFKKNVVLTLDAVARQLGNTRSVCKKYYVHPILPTLYENQRLLKYFNELDELLKCAPDDQNCEETVLLKILKKEKMAI